MKKQNAILRTKRIKTTDAVGKMFSHNLRTKYQNNVDKTKTHLNEILLDELDFKNNKDYSENLKKYYEKIGATQKNNSVQMMEFVLTASPDFFKNISKKDLDSWKQTQLDFAKKKFGDNLKFAVLHLDEKSPHIHLAITVEEKKIHYYKNRYGITEKEKISLNARRYNRQFLRILQTEYANANEKFGLVRGIYNSKATHQTIKDFHKKIEEVSKKDYSKNVERKIEQIFKESSFFGIVQEKKAKEKLSQFISVVFKNSKMLEAILNFNQVKNVKELNKILKSKEEINELRADYQKAIKRDKELMFENKKMLEQIELLKNRLEEYENKSLNSEVNKLDKSRRIR